MKKLIVITAAFLSITSDSANAQYWSALGEGIGFPSWNRVEYSDGTQTGSDGPVTGPPVASICFFNGQLYAAGCDDVDGPTRNIVKWNGTVWSPVGEGVYTVGGGGYDSWINELLVHNGELYVAGRFTHAGTISANNIAKWNGTEWSAVGDGLGDYYYEVSSLVIYNGALYAGGRFFDPGGLKNIAKWDGNHWRPVGGGIDVYTDYWPYGSVSSLVVHEGELYAGGYFDTTGVGTNNIVKWDGTSWSAVGKEINTAVFCLASYNGELYAGGNFVGLRKWDGSNWTSSAAGINGYVYSLLVNSGSLFAAGHFDSAANVVANNIAKWNGTEWSALGKGIDKAVVCMTIHDNAFFAAGNFDIACDVWVNKIAKWIGGCTSPPPTPQTINSASTSCKNRYTSFFVTPVTDAASFTWTTPAGWTGNSISNKLIVLAGMNNGTISVTANNACGSSAPQIIHVTVKDTVPGQTSNIEGSSDVCSNSVQTYFIEPIHAADFYEWYLPGGWQGHSKTNTITVQTGTRSGIVAVRAWNYCSISNTQTKNVVIKSSIIQPGPMSGDDSVTAGHTVLYSISPVVGATDYVWSVRGGGTIVSGGNTASVSVYWFNVGNHTHTVEVYDGCGISTETKNVTVSKMTGVTPHVPEPGKPFHIAILPDPSAAKFYLRLKGVQAKSIKVEVFSATGQVINRVESKANVNDYSQSIELANLARGIYVVRIMINGKIYARKIFKY